jgi:hypothetical protein
LLNIAHSSVMVLSTWLIMSLLRYLIVVCSKQCLARHRIYLLANTMQMIPTRGVQIGELLRSTISSTPSHMKYHRCIIEK